MISFFFFIKEIKNLMLGHTENLFPKCTYSISIIGIAAYVRCFIMKISEWMEALYYVNFIVYFWHKTLQG